MILEAKQVICVKQDRVTWEKMELTTAAAESALLKHISNLTLKIHHTHTCMLNSACRSGGQLAQIEVIMKSSINTQVCSIFPTYSRFKKSS